MATVTYISYKPGGNASASAMRAVIAYCLQPYKTETEEKVYCTSGQNCTPTFASQEFMATKAAFGKTDGVYFYHYVQSFSPDENVTPEEANAIGLELAKQWSGHEVLVTTHVDRAHIHTHFIINSVNYENGRKLRQSPNSLKELRDASDKICISHGLSVLEPYEKAKTSGVKNGEYRSAVRRDSWKFRLISAINSAMNESLTKDEFIAYMSVRGYDVAWTDDRKHITYTCRCEPKFKDGSYRKCRDDKLHDEKYLKTNMEAEFYARQKLYTKTYPGTVGTDEFTTDTAAHAEPDYGYDPRRTMEYADADGRTGRQDQRFAHRGDEIFDTECGEGYGEVRDENGSGRTASSNAAGDERSDENGRRTGWESSRRSFEENRRTGTSGRCHVVDQAHGARRHFLHGSNSLLSVGILNGLGIFEDGEESEEEKRQREAQNTGSAIGAAVGLAIGAITALHDSDNQTDQTQDAPDDGQGFDFIM